MLIPYKSVRQGSHRSFFIIYPVGPFMLLKPILVVLYYLSITKNVASVNLNNYNDDSEGEIHEEGDGFEVDKRLLSRYEPKEYHINNFISKYLQKFNQNGQHSYRFGLIGKRSDTPIQMADFQQLNGFGFSKFGKRSLIFGNLLVPRDNGKKNSAETHNV